MFEVLPALGNAGEIRGEDLPYSRDWVDVLGRQLEDADIVRISSAQTAHTASSDDEASVWAPRQTALTTRVMDHLVGFGIRARETAADSAFAIIDLSGLDVHDALRLVRHIHQARLRSMPIWRHGSEVFYGPLAIPMHTACWNCCRLRLFDSISGASHPRALEEPVAARVAAENVLLALRYPDVAAYGCVVIQGDEISTLHSVLPMPWCETCGGAAAIVGPSKLASLTHSLHVPEELRLLADPRAGLVRRVLLYDGDGTDTAVVPSCSSVVMAPYRDGHGLRPSFNGEGKGATREDAIRSALGEGLERYAASLWDVSTLTYAPFSTLADRAFDPRWLVLYDDAVYARPGFPYSRFDPDRRMLWAPGHWLDTNELVQVPALATYMNFPVAADERFCQTTSSGLAAGTTLEDAALRALYELIERDAFMLFWLARRPGRRVAEDGCDHATSQALRDTERLGATTELYVLDVGTRHPTCVCLGLGDGHSWPGITIGLGTHADIDIALQRAVFEHGHYGAYMRRLMQDGRHRDVLKNEDVVTSLDHALYYVHPAHATGLDSFRGGTEAPVSLASLRSSYRQPANLSTCVSRLLEAGIRTAAVDVTSPDVKLAPIRVVRAFGVYMQPIYFGNAHPRVKNPRLDRLRSSAVETNPHPIA